MDFFKPKVQPGWLITLAGLTGAGKTHVSNFFSGSPSFTFFIDSHGTFSTIETLTLLGQQQVWRATEWTDLMVATKDFIRINKGRKATLVLDTGSELVTMAQNYIMIRDNKKGIINYGWGEVWKEIMAFLKMVTEAGHDLVLTLQLKRVYDEFMDEKSQKVAIWTGDYEAKQWKDLPYQCTCQIQLEHGITAPGKKEVILRNRVFTRLIKSRYSPVQTTKPFIVGPITRANIAPQLLPYSGTWQDCCWELMQAQATDKEFCRELGKLAGSIPEKWQPPAAQGPSLEETPAGPGKDAAPTKEVPRKAIPKAKTETKDEEWG